MIAHWRIHDGVPMTRPGMIRRAPMEEQN